MALHAREFDEAIAITQQLAQGTFETRLAGTFGIDIVDGKHFYRFEYTLPQ